MANPIKYTSTTQENSINTGNFAIKISSVTFYNHELTNNEISTTYNATRSRYGL